MNQQTIQPLYGLIPAAGKGVRARPYTHEIHKGMLNINGVPNIERIITLMRDDLGIEKIVIVTGYLGDSIRSYFGDGKKFRVAITYVENKELERGWAWSVRLAKPYIDGYFCIMLCDESYLNSNHHLLKNFKFERFISVCAGLPVDDASLIKKNYAIERNGDRIIALREKPEVVSNDLMGSGTFICNPDIFSELDKAFEKNKQVDFVSFLNALVKMGKPVGFFELNGTYVNINDRDSLHLARYHDRITHFDQCSASLLICAEGDEEEISFTINRYRELNFFAQIAVVLPANNRIHERVASTGADIILCPPQITGFGERMRYGLSQLTSDILVTTEADYSFPNRDVEKLLSYLKEADMVIGTRTTRQLIEQGSTMRGVVRLAHTALGFLLELLWWTREGRFTDVGCTFRAIWRNAYEQIENNLDSKGPEFLAEMVIVSLNRRLRVLEIPVNYFNRSRSQNRHYRNATTFFRLLVFIIFKRFSRSYPHQENNLESKY